MPLAPEYLYGAETAPKKITNVPKAVDYTKTPQPVPAYLFKVTLTDPAAGATDAYIATGVAGPDTATATYVPGDADWDGTLDDGIPDYPRNAVVTVTHDTSVVALSGVITGKDLYGRTITEAWSVTATGTSKTFTGKKSFASITSITVVAAADASADTVTFGTGNVFGLPYVTANVNVIGEMENGAKPTAGVIVAGSSASTADCRGTYTPNSTPDGSKDFVFYFLCDDPTTATTATS